MTTATITLSNQGQVEIPKQIPDELHWESGQELVLETTQSGVLLRSRAAKKLIRLEDLRGFLQHQGPALSTAALCEPVDAAYDETAATQPHR